MGINTRDRQRRYRLDKKTVEHVCWEFIKGVWDSVQETVPGDIIDVVGGDWVEKAD